MDVLVDVLDSGQLGDTGLGLLVGHLGSRRGEVLIALDRTQSVNSASGRRNELPHAHKKKKLKLEH